MGYLRVHSNAASDAASNAGGDADIGDCQDLCNFGNESSSHANRSSSSSAAPLGSSMAASSSALPPSYYGSGFGLSYSRGGRSRPPATCNRDIFQRPLRPSSDAYSANGACSE